MKGFSIFGRKEPDVYNYVDMRGRADNVIGEEKAEEACMTDEGQKSKPFDIRDYQTIPTHDIRGFDSALLYLKEGLRVTRAGWNGPGQFLEMQVPDAHSKMSLPYIFITTVQGDRVPWLASQTDLLANDWRAVR